MWSLLRPLLLFLILYVVFIKFLKLGVGIPHAPVYLLLGIVIWNFFNEMTVQGLGCIVGKEDLIRKIRIPRWSIILSTSLSATINLMLNLVVVSIFMISNHVGIMGTIAWLPLILVEAYLLSVGVALFLSAMFVKFRDIGYIWEVLLQAGFYLTPIIYPLSRLKNPTLLKLVMINPMAQIIQDARYATVTHKTITIYQIFQGSSLAMVPFVIVGVILIGGILYFRKESKYFAENI
jgi:ABC-2 type transport system permease protein